MPISFSTPMTPGSSSKSAARSLARPSPTFVRIAKNTAQFFLVRHGHIHKSAAPVPREDAYSLDVSVGNDVNLACSTSQDCDAQRHFFHHTLEPGDTHRIADAVLIFKKHKETRDHVFDEALGSEANRQAGNACGGNILARGYPSSTGKIKRDDNAQNRSATLRTM